MSNAPIDDSALPADIDLDDPIIEVAGPSLVARLVAEVTGTFIFILLALTVATFADGKIIVMLGFAISLWAMIVAFGGISGGHFNPAVTVGAWVAGRFSGRDVAPYILAQTVGATAAGATLWALLGSNPQVTDARTIVNGVAIGFGDHSPTQFPLAAGAVVEVLATAMFVAIILAATSFRAIPALAAPTIGLGLGILLMFAIPFTNGALNPARATGAALFAETWALQQLWLFWLAPIVGGAIAGLLFRAFGPEEDLLSTQIDAMVAEEEIEIVEIVEER